MKGEKKPLCPKFYGYSGSSLELRGGYLAAQAGNQFFEDIELAIEASVCCSLCNFDWPVKKAKMLLHLALIDLPCSKIALRPRIRHLLNTE